MTWKLWPQHSGVSTSKIISGEKSRRVLKDPIRYLWYGERYSVQESVKRFESHEAVTELLTVHHQHVVV